MKLRYLATARLPTERAHGIQIMSMCNAFAASGAEVELVVPRRRNGTPGNAFDYYGLPRSFALTYLPVFDLTRFAILLGRLPYILLNHSFARRALAQTRGRPADLYFIRDETTFIRFAEAGLPCLFEMHTVPRHLERYKTAFDKCIGLVAISRGIRDELIEAGVPNDKIVVAPDGVDLEKFNARVSRDEARRALRFDSLARIALYTGQFLPWKGVDTLIEAAVTLPPKCEVVIVGGGAGRERELKEKVRATSAKVRFVGQVRHKDIPQYLAASDCVVIPNSARERISSHHTSPLKLFEAMAMGRAIVASDLPSLREALDSSCAVFVPPDNAPALSRALSELLPDERRCAKLGANARDCIEGYDWKARARLILDMFRRLDRNP